VGEILAIIAVSIVASMAGIVVMLAAELALYNFAQSNSFTIEPGRYHLWAALRPHVLRGELRGHDITVTYSLGEYFGYAENRGISSIVCSVPPHPKLHLRVASWRLFEKRSRRTGCREFDNWVTLNGGPKAFLTSVLSDDTIVHRLKDTISPVFSFTSTLTLTPTGPLVLRHKSVFLTAGRIRSDVELLADIAAIIEQQVPSARAKPAA